MDLKPVKTNLRDGTPILVRPVVPDDKGLLKEGLSRLSPTSRYYRFMTGGMTLSKHMLKHLTEIDYDNHMAWGALELGHPEEVGLGVARYVRLDEDPTIAEAAVAVVDSHHGRGLGMLLLGFLTRSAAQSGIRTFRAYVLPENDKMLHIIKDLGGHLSTEEDEILRVDLPIPKDTRDFPNTPAARVLKAVAEYRLPPLVGRSFHTGTLQKVLRAVSHLLG